MDSMTINLSHGTVVFLFVSASIFLVVCGWELIKAIFRNYTGPEDTFDYFMFGFLLLVDGANYWALIHYLGKYL